MGDRTTERFRKRFVDYNHALNEGVTLVNVSDVKKAFDEWIKSREGERTIVTAGGGSPMKRYKNQEYEF